MITVHISSEVNTSLPSAIKSFNQSLFEFLLPPGAQLIRFDGSKKNDQVHLKLPLAGMWISHITDNGENENEWWFIDEGMRIPFPLRHWKHRHRIISIDKHKVMIKDEMTFSSGLLLLDYLLRPFLYLAFAPRKRLYKKYYQSLEIENNTPS